MRADFSGAGLSEQRPDGGDEAVRIEWSGDGVALPAGKRRRADVIPSPFRNDRNDGLGTVGFVAGPLGELPARSEDGEHDPALFAARFNFGVPPGAVAFAHVDRVEPHAESGGGQQLMEFLGVDQVC